MKRVLVSCFVLIIMIIFGCQKESIVQEETAKSPVKKIEQQAAKGTYSPSAQKNELVIVYPEGTTEHEKQQKRIEYGVQDYKLCECADQRIELWIFAEDIPFAELEGKKVLGNSDDDLDGSEFNPNMKIQEDAFVGVGPVLSSDFGVNLQKSSNQGIVIAVLDTGLMYDYPEFVNTDPFLYSGAPDACNSNGYTELFGWNFVENNNNPYDDYYGKHGTIVTSLIMSKLNAANIEYQILPVKVADHTGNIRYFDALCGFQYAAKKEDVKVINMSFGWYGQERELLEKFIDEAPSDVLIVSSAGNDGFDNDDTPHYPSSYDVDNMLSIASLKAIGSTGTGGFNTSVIDANSSSNSNSGLAIFSNRGVYSVDIAAPGENLPFMFNNQLMFVNGTSYSSALAAGYSAALYQPGMTGTELKSLVINNCIYRPDLQEIRYASHIPQ